MSVEETHARIANRVRQAIDASNIAFSTAQRAQLDGLVVQITNNVLLEFDELLSHMAPAPAAPVPAPAATLPAAMTAPAATSGTDEETVLWEGRPFLSIGEHYVITSERVRIIRGVIGKDHEDIELVRVKDVDHTQGVGERLLNIGDIILHSSDTSLPDATLRNVTNPDQVHEILRRAMLNARRKYPFIFEQRM
ncbi:MAG TPA: PH domain-containing protein [Anaerolineae bacterium]